MKAYSNILFDLDGTIINSKDGIKNSFEHAFKKLGIIVKNCEEFEQFIGINSLNKVFKHYNLSKSERLFAINFFREYYENRGMFENSLYEGADNLLAKLSERNKIVGLATSKPKPFAQKILKNYNLDKYFNVIEGSNLENENLTKTDIIKIALDKMKNKNPGSTVMIGDRFYDVQGAKNNSIDCIAVEYGYNSKDEFLNHKPDYVVSNINELEQYLI